MWHQGVWSRRMFAQSKFKLGVFFMFATVKAYVVKSLGLAMRTAGPKVGLCAPREQMFRWFRAIW